MDLDNNIRGIPRILLSYISERVGERWRGLLRILGCQEHIIEQLDEDAHIKGWNSSERIFQGLKGWVTSEETAPSISDIIDKMFLFNTELAEDIRNEKYLKKENGSDPLTSLCEPAICTSCPGREEDIKKLLTCLCPSSNVKVTILIGLPGVGKSRLLQAVNYKLQGMYPDYHIFRPTISQGTDTFEKVCADVMAFLNPIICDNYNTKAHLRLKRKLLTFKKPFLLILDMSHVFTNAEFWDKTWEHTSSLLTSERGLMKVIISVSHKPEISHIDFTAAETIILRELPRKASVNLMRSIAPAVSEEEASEIYHFCGGIPVILRHLAANFRASPNNVRKLLDELSGINSLNGSLRDILRECVLNKHYSVLFKSMENKYRWVLVKLSVITGTFGERMAHEIIGRQHGYVLETLVSKYLLLERRGEVYYLHRVFKEFIELNAMESKELKSMYYKSLKKYIALNLELVHTLNNIFMSWHLPSLSQFTENELETAGKGFKCVCGDGPTKHCFCVLDNEPCGCNRASIAMSFFESRKTHIVYCMRKGMDLSDVWMDVIDYTSDAISFLNKVLPYDDLHQLLENMFTIVEKKKDKVRLAYVYVSLSFIRMANLGLDRDQEKVWKMLKKAMEILQLNIMELKQRHRLEVLAHCYSKLGRILGSRGEQEGKEYIDKALKIRANEAVGTNVVLKAATYVDLANFYRDFGELELGLYLLQEHALPVYKRYLRMHPFCASTLRFMGNILFRMGRFREAKLKYILALQIQCSLKECFPDVVMTLWDKARNHIELGEDDLAIKCLDRALVIGEQTFIDRSLISSMLVDLAGIYKRIGDEENSELFMERGKKARLEARERKRSRTYERLASRISLGHMVSEVEEDNNQDTSMLDKSMISDVICGNVIRWTIFVIVGFAATSYFFAEHFSSSICDNRQLYS